MPTAPGVCVCVCVCVSTAPGVGALGWVKYREHISLLVILCIIVYVTNKKILDIFFFQNRYPIMVKCYNIGKPIYRSISNPHSDLSVQTHTGCIAQWCCRARRCISSPAVTEG